MASMWDSLGGIAGGLFGLGNDPYKDAMKKMKRYTDQAAGYQNPFYNEGKNAIPQYQDWLSGMKDPSAFINDLMGGYQESPWSNYLQDQSMRAAKNMGSASGLTGSTPLMLQAQENSQNLASQDMEKWLSNVLGINTQYGSGLNNEINRGQQSANMLSNLYSGLGGDMAGASYGSNMNTNRNMSSILAGLFGLAPFLF